MKELNRETPHIHRLVIPFLDIYTTVFFVETPEGTVLFDTATYPEDVDNFMIPAMAALHIRPEDLRWVVISHNHRDHGGGLARLAECFPHVQIAAGSENCGNRVPGREIRVLSDGDSLCGVLKVVTIPGHTADCVGILDTRTRTLLSGDGLQLYGIYGSGNWGANIGRIRDHLEAGEKLLKDCPQTVLAAHDYHPMGYRADGADVEKYIHFCEEALRAVWAYAQQYPAEGAETLSANYNAASGLPKVGPHIFRAVRETWGNP